MQFYDIFNGDADGLCALHQLRLDEPRASRLITGVKRDTGLVARAGAAAGDEMTVLDCPLTRNRDAVAVLLEHGVHIRYFDHHDPGPIPQHPNFKAVIDTAPNVCSSLLVDRYLDGRHRAWAVVAAFGDNLVSAAQQAAAPLRLAAGQVLRLKELGECLNYNAYGESVADLHYDPADLYETMRRYPDPLDFVVDEPVFEVLRQGYSDDLYRAEEVKPIAEAAGYAVYTLPDAAWARRVSGVFANRLAQQHPLQAHAILTQRGEGFSVSVRAPIAAPRGADELCREFESGGGRVGAGGINFLPQTDFDRLVTALRRRYGA